jgi:hypothetical protein
MSTAIGPPFRVTQIPSGDAVVTLPLKWAETLKEKLRGYGFPSEQSATAPGAGGGAVTTLNFGTGVDVPKLQQVIDSFTIPPTSVVMGS